MKIGCRVVSPRATERWRRSRSALLRGPGTGVCRRIAGEVVATVLPPALAPGGEHRQRQEEPGEAQPATPPAGRALRASASHSPAGMTGRHAAGDITAADVAAAAVGPRAVAAVEA